MHNPSSMTVSPSHPAVWASLLLTVVTVVLGVAIIVVVAGVVAGVLAEIPTPPGLVYSGLAWTLLAAVLAVLALGAWLAVPRTSLSAWHNTALVCAPVAAALVGLSAHTNTVALAFVFVSLVVIGLVSRHLAKGRTAVLVLCMVAAFGVAAFSLLGLGMRALDPGTRHTIHLWCHPTGASRPSRPLWTRAPWGATSNTSWSPPKGRTCSSRCST